MDSNSIVDYFVNKGYAPAHAAGIAGNLAQESNNNPSIVNRTSGAFGLAQWLGSRKTQLKQYADEMGTSVHDPAAQLGFIDHELNTTESRARDRLLQTQSPSEAAAVFSDHFERAGQNEKNNSRRAKLAIQALNDYSGGGGGGGGGGMGGFQSPEDFEKEWNSTHPDKPISQSQNQKQSIQSPEDFEKEWNSIHPDKAISAKTTQQAQPESDDPFDSPAGEVMKKMGLGARGLIEGIAGAPAGVYNLAGMLPDSIGGKSIHLPKFLANENDNNKMDTEQYGRKLADLANLPTSQDTPEDKVISQISKGVGSFVVPASLASKFGAAGGIIGNAGKFMGGDYPMTSIAGITAGSGAQEMARESGATEGQQLAANIAGNLIGGGGAGVMNMAGRTGGRLKDALINSNAGVAGRALNRAAGEQAPQVIADLESGVVPSITGKMIKAYQPTSSEIAGNAGISTILRQAGLDSDTAVMLADRQFQNAKSVKDYAQKQAVGSQSYRDAKKAALWEQVNTVSKPMRVRDLPVDLAPVEAQIDAAILKNKGNPAVTAGLEKLKSALPQGGTAGFNEAYNYKQWIDEALESTNLIDPEIMSLKKAKAAMGDIKSSLADTMTATEPEFKDFLFPQAKGISDLERRSLAEALINNSSANTPKVSNTPTGQEELYALSGAKLKAITKNPKTMAELSQYQQKVFEKAQQHAALESRDQLGAIAGSNTAQHLNIRDVVAQDILAAMTGTGKLSDKIGAGISHVAGAILPGGIAKTRTMSSTDVAKILTKAKLDPQYAAYLMKTYGLENKNFNDSLAKATLRGLMTGDK
jgi:hypothetical protein